MVGGMGTKGCDTQELIARRSDRSEGECAEASSARCRAMAERIVELSATIHAAEGELVALLADFHEAKGWMGAGIRSLEHWLTVHAGFTTAEGRARAALSDRATELPHLMEALHSGALSLGAARNAARVATSSNDEQITGIATTATAPQAARVFRTYAVVEAAERRRRRCSEDADTDDSGGDERPDDGGGPLTWWRHWWDDHGYLLVDGRLDPTGGAELIAALDAAVAALGADRGSAVRPAPTDPDTCGGDGNGTGAGAGVGATPGRAGPVSMSHHAPVSRVDAIGELAAAALAGLRHRGLHGRGGERFSVHVTIDVATLAGTRPGVGVLDSGQRVDAELVRSWLAGSRLDVLLHDKGRPLWLGRDQRVATAGQRRALFERDRGCAFPGCGHARFVDAHHVRSWEQGGSTDVDNLVLLCRRHHRLLHSGEYSISMVEGRPCFLRTSGEPVCCGPPRWRSTGRRDGDRAPSGPLESAPTLRPRPDPSRVRRSADPLTHYGIDVYVAHLLGG